MTSSKNGWRNHSQSTRLWHMSTTDGEDWWTAQRVNTTMVNGEKGSTKLPMEKSKHFLDYF